MQTPADHLTFLKDVCTPVASGKWRGAEALMELPSMTALSCVYPISSGGSLGRLTSAFYISANQVQYREGPCADCLCPEREKLSFSKLDKINILN